MKKIDSQYLPLQFFLSHKEKITDVVKGALQYGGATKNLDTNEAWSNVEGDKYIRVAENNTISIFLPTTDNVNQEADKSKIVRTQKLVIDRMQRVKNETVTVEKAIGTWYSDELEQVITENVFMISQNTDGLTKREILEYMKIADFVKKAMRQEAVSISLNNSLLLV